MKVEKEKSFKLEKKEDEGPFRSGMFEVLRINYSWWARNMFPVQELPPGAILYYDNDENKKNDS